MIIVDYGKVFGVIKNRCVCDSCYCFFISVYYISVNFIFSWVMFYI